MSTDRGFKVNYNVKEEHFQVFEKVGKTSDDIHHGGARGYCSALDVGRMSSDAHIGWAVIVSLDWWRWWVDEKTYYVSAA